MPKGAESIKYEGVSFNKTDAASKSLAQFQEEQKHHGLSPEQLKEVWQLAKGTKQPEDISKGLMEGPSVASENTAINVNKPGKGK